MRRCSVDDSVVGLQQARPKHEARCEGYDDVEFQHAMRGISEKEFFSNFKWPRHHWPLLPSPSPLCPTAQPALFSVPCRWCVEMAAALSLLRQRSHSAMATAHFINGVA